MRNEMTDDSKGPTQHGAMLEYEIHDIAAFNKAMKVSMEPYLERIKGALRRVQTLIEVAGAMKDNSPMDKETKEDILRAAVVLTHAHLEDFLRTISVAVLPAAGDEKCFDKVPLAGSGSGRPEKFFLGKLVQYRGKLVDDVLRESVSGYLEHRTFNDTEEISTALRSLGVNVSLVEESFPQIQQMIRRRHQIVHRADRVVREGPEVLEGIDARCVRDWTQATINLMTNVLALLLMELIPLKDETAGIRKRDLKSSGKSQATSESQLSRPDGASRES
jgi:RiboL-PSP-HEPN